MMGHPIDTLWILISAALVLIMQAGFCCLETGFVRAKNSANVALKNFGDLCLSAICYWSFGFALMFGLGPSGLLDAQGFFFGSADGQKEHMAFFVFQLMFCGTAITIVSGAVAERMRFAGYLVLTFVVAACIYPVVGHWVWGGVLGTGRPGWLEVRGFIDFAGSAVVHSVAGWIALAAILVLGPRLGRFGAEGRRIQGHALPLATLGVLLLWLGWLGFNGGSTFAFDDRVPGILINTVLGGASGGLAGLLLATWREGCTDVGRSVNGALAGLVSVTAGCHVLSPGAAVAAGMLGGVVSFYATHWLERAELDDVIGAIPVHGFAGVWGTLAVALLGDPELWGTGNSRWEQFWVQGIGAISVFAYAFGVGFVLLATINRFCPLRCTPEAERLGLNVAEHGARMALLDLLTEMEHHRREGDVSRRVHVEAYSEVGEIAQQYNRVCESVMAASQERVRALRAAESSEARFRQIENHIREVFFLASANFDALLYASPAFNQIWGLPSEQGPSLETWVEGMHVDDRDAVEAKRLHMNRGMIDHQYRIVRPDGEVRWVRERAALARNETDGANVVVGTAEDVTDQRCLEDERARGQKLEALGQLAAGVAHEINTPIQYVGDNLRFLENSCSEFLALAELIGDADPMGDDDSNRKVLQKLYESAAQADVNYLREEVPRAIQQSLDGVERVATIVQAMKDFSHPGGRDRVAVDVTEAIKSTLTIARNEWKYVATVETEFEDGVPLVPLYVGEFNQALLNIIVNAAHAIGDVVADSGAKGKITVHVTHGDGQVFIRIRDTGPGIPEEVRSKIFDPFFTTKGVGKGTGQGLSIAHSVIVDQHGGSLSVETDRGEGTVFVIGLPLLAREGQDPEEDAAQQMSM